jgi:DNA-binding response OmpR family regulator
VLLLSADLPEVIELAASGDDFGATALMEKPFKAAELRAYISRLLNERVLHRTARRASHRRAFAGRRH